jgi:hypothetical protein
MSTLAAYIDEMVKPTFRDFEDEQTPRRAFLAAVTLMHCVDRAKVDRKASGLKKKGENLRMAWGQESTAFNIVDAIANRFKHTQSDLECDRPPQWANALSVGDVLARMNVIQFRSTMIEGIQFVQSQIPK